MRGRSGLGIGIYASTQEMNEGERTKNDKGKKEREKKNSLVPCTHACLLHLLMNLTTTRVDHPTPSSIGNPKRVSQPPTKDIISTKNRLISVQLLMVLYRHCCCCASVVVVVVGSSSSVLDGDGGDHGRG